MPSMIMINNQTLPAKIFGFLSSLAESGLTEVGHYVSVMDIQRYHQTNLSEIQEELSKVIIKTQTLMDNPIPMQQNNLDLKTNLNNEVLQAYREAQQQSLQLMATKMNHNLTPGTEMPDGLAMRQKPKAASSLQYTIEKVDHHIQQSAPTSALQVQSRSPIERPQGIQHRRPEQSAQHSLIKKSFQPYIPQKPEPSDDALTYEKYQEMDESDRKQARARMAATPLRKLVIKEQASASGGSDHA